MIKRVDLTEPINNDHFRYKNFIREMEWTKDGHTKVIPYMSLSHGFTHIDAPLHMVPGGKVLADFDLLSFLIGKASILDVSFIKPNEGITREMLEEAWIGCKNHDFIIVKTCFGLQRASNTPEFWSDAPYLTPEAVSFLVSLKPKVVGYDFPQDYAIRLGAASKMEPETSPTHFQILPNDILMIEYMTNLWNLPVKNCDICALPLKIGLRTTDCASIRVVASYEE